MRSHQAIQQEPQVAALYAAYMAARYRWGEGGRWHVVRIGAPSPEIEDRFPEAAGFGMLSAWNPYSIPQAEAVNRDADERLQVELEAHGVVHRPAFAEARNRTWREPNWVVMDLPVAELDALAQRFGQLGTLHWWRGKPVRLRMYAARPNEVAGHPHVDWVE